MTQTQKVVDSIIEVNRTKYVDLNNYLFYFTQSAWGGKRLYLINIDLKTVQYFDFFNNTQVAPRKIKKINFSKLQNLIRGLSGNYESIVNMDDGAEGMLNIYKNGKLIYKHYYLGILPKEISKLNSLLEHL